MRFSGLEVKKPAEETAVPRDIQVGSQKNAVRADKGVFVKSAILLVAAVMLFLAVSWLGGFDLIKFSTFRFTDGTMVLANRFTDKVEYVWVQGRWVVPSSLRLLDSEFTPFELMQHRYDAEKRRPKIRVW